MPDRSHITQTVQVGLETTENTAVAALTKLSSLNIMLGPDIAYTVFRPIGRRRASVVTTGKKSTVISADGPPSYQELPYILSSVYKKVTPTTPGGATNARDWTFTQSNSVEETTATYTFEQGSSVWAARAAGCFFEGFVLNGDTDTVNITAGGRGRLWTTTATTYLSTNEVVTITVDATGGTFTVTFGAQTTAAQAFNVAAATLQTQLEGLSSIGTGNITVTGGPGDAGGTTPYTLTFIGALGQTDVGAVTTGAGSLTGGAMTAAVAVVTAGAAAAELAIIPIIPEEVDVFIDPTSGTIGTTKLTRLLGWSIGEATHQAAFWTVNSANDGSMAGRVTTPPGSDIVLSVVMDAQGVGLYNTYALDNTSLLLKLIATGGEIDAGVNNYEADFRATCKVKSVSQPVNNQELFAFDIGLEIVTFTSFRVRNALTAL